MHFIRLETYDWRAQESLINASLPQYRTSILYLPSHPAHRIHFVHKRSSEPSAIPLLFCHGWPGSVLEVSKIIEPLTDPSEGENPQRFHVVAPSIPGFSFSDASHAEGMDLSATASIFDLLMKRLGYPRYVAHGGGRSVSILYHCHLQSLSQEPADPKSSSGSHITRLLATRFPASCIATHVTSISVRPPSLSHRPIIWFQYQFARLTHRMFPTVRTLAYHPIDFSSPSQELYDGNTDNHRDEFDLSRYPQTLAYALCDSPVGLLAYIRQRLYTSSSTYPWTPTELLNWTVLHWLPGPEAGLRLHRDSARNMISVRQQWSPTPLGITVFAASWRGGPPAWGACVQPLLWVRRHEGCGAYAAWERPIELVDDLRDFFGKVVGSRMTEKAVRVDLEGGLQEID